MKKQTAVEWLMEQILPTISITLEDVCIKQLIEIAIAMEKEQMESAYREGYDDCSLGRFADAEKYYNETFL